MKTLIAVLLLLSFLQTTLIPLDLVLLVIVLRTYIKTDSSNLYLGFGFGLLIAFLGQTSLGPTPLVYLTLVQFTSLLKRTPISNYVLTVIPLCLVITIANTGINALILHQSTQFWPKVVIESLLGLPIYMAIKVWEERFVVRKEIKLKV